MKYNEPLFSFTDAFLYFSYATKKGTILHIFFILVQHDLSHND